MPETNEQFQKWVASSDIDSVMGDLKASRLDSFKKDFIMSEDFEEAFTQYIEFLADNGKLVMDDFQSPVWEET